MEPLKEGLPSPGAAATPGGRCSDAARAPDGTSAGAPAGAPAGAAPPAPDALSPSRAYAEGRWSGCGQSGGVLSGSAAGRCEGLGWAGLGWAGRACDLPSEAMGSVDAPAAPAGAAPAPPPPLLAAANASFTRFREEGGLGMTLSRAGTAGAATVASASATRSSRDAGLSAAGGATAEGGTADAAVPCTR